MKVLVVGAAGKVGGIIRDALEGAHDCYYYDRHAVSGREDRTTIADVNDEAKIREALEGMEGVVYLAAGRHAGARDEYGDPDVAMSVNVAGWFRLLELGLAMGVRRFVYASSMSVYRSDRMLGRVESDLPSCWDTYGVSKVLAEEVCRLAARACPEAVLVALRLVYPSTEREWREAERAHPGHWWQPTGPVDTGRLFLAALACERAGAHVLNVGGDAGDTAYCKDVARATIGWAPRGE